MANKPQDEMEKVAEIVARRMCLATVGKVLPSDLAAAKFIFREELLPLLEAGQAMADHVNTLNYEDENEPHNCSGCGSSTKTWDAALKAIWLRGRGE